MPYRRIPLQGKGGYRKGRQARDVGFVDGRHSPLIELLEDVEATEELTNQAGHKIPV